MANQTFVKLGTAFDMDRLIVDAPNSKKSMSTSSIFASDGKGNKTRLFFELEQATIPSVGLSHPYGMKEKQKKKENISGLYIPYPVHEKGATRELLNKIYGKCLEEIQNLCEEEETDLPESTINSYKKAKKEEDWMSFLKPLIRYDKFNIKLMSKYNNGEFTCTSKVVNRYLLMTSS